jgi:outer membrane protein W
LPVVGKFYFREDSKWQPFLGTGYAFQRAWATTEGTTIFSQQGEYTTNAYKTTAKASNIGVVAAAGVQFRQWRLTITPEVRYIRWGSTQDQRFQVNPNQVQATVGVTF